MRLLGALAALVLIMGAVDAASHASGAGPGPVAHSAKKKCGKHRKHGKHRRHCRRKGAGGGGSAESGPAVCNTGLPGRVTGRETEYDIVLSRPNVACGTVIVEQDNLGEDPHDLQLQKAGAGAPAYSFGELAPGGVAKQTVTLGRGTWTLFCSLPGHYAAGMHVNLTVD